MPRCIRSRCHVVVSPDQHHKGGDYPRLEEWQKRVSKRMLAVLLPIVAVLSFTISFILSDSKGIVAAAEEQTRAAALSTRATRLTIDTGTGQLADMDPESGTVSLRRPVAEKSAGRHVFITESGTAHAIAIIDRWQPFVRVFDQASSRSTNPAVPLHITVADNPQAIAFTPDGSRLLVACDPPGKADRPVCVVNLKTGLVSRRLIPGSSNLRGIAADPSGKFALATHLVPKSDIPATQIEQGWVFTNAISVVPLNATQPVVTLPLDQRTQGYANPEGVAISPNAQRAYVTHAGADVVSVIDVPALTAVAEEVRMRELQKSEAGTTDIARTGTAPARASYRSDDLRMPRRYVRARIGVGSNPRGVTVSPDGQFVAVFNRLDDSISVIETATNSVVRTIALPGVHRAPRDERVRLGEKLFHSGRLSFSGQFSCASCHPDGQSDGLNWDLPADGFNNFHNTKTLLGTSGTAPYGWTGSSPNLRERFNGTLQHLFQHEPTEEESGALEAYLAQLNYPADATQRNATSSAAAERGRALFQGVARCSSCHRGGKLTDQRQHDVGTGAEGGASYDTPSLVRIRETAPYLHDGRAETLAEIFSRWNPDSLHGNAADLTPDQLVDLVEYLKSL